MNHKYARNGIKFSMKFLGLSYMTVLRFPWSVCMNRVFFGLVRKILFPSSSWGVKTVNDRLLLMSDVMQEMWV